MHVVVLLLLTDYYALGPFRTFRFLTMVRRLPRVRWNVSLLKFVRMVCVGNADQATAKCTHFLVFAFTIQRKIPTPRCHVATRSSNPFPLRFVVNLGKHISTQALHGTRW